MFHNVLSISPFSGHETPRSREQPPPARPAPGTFSSLRPGQPGQLPAVTLALPAVVRQLALYMIIASQLKPFLLWVKLRCHVINGTFHHRQGRSVQQRVTLGF